MLYSMLIKLAMLVVTMGMVFWIGWTVPQSRYVDADRGAETQGNGETPVRSTGPSAVSTAAPVALLAPPQTSTQAPRRPALQKLDLNRATEQEIEALPGIGPVLAERIVGYRQSRGAFRNVDQLRNVKGIGKKKFERIRTFVSVTPSTVPAQGRRRTT